jgi:hypothetical protein
MLITKRDPVETQAPEERNKLWIGVSSIRSWKFN